MLLVFALILIKGLDIYEDLLSLSLQTSGKNMQIHENWCYYYYYYYYYICFYDPHHYHNHPHINYYYYYY